MTTPTIRFLLLAIAVILLTPARAAESGRPRNYIVLLDLSDRLLIPGQDQRDMALVQAVFDDFEKHVRQQLVIGSKDRFRVVIAPQRGTTYRIEPFTDALYLDLGSVPSKDKITRLKALKTDLLQKLRALYKQAMAGKHQASNFAGCDLWQYANEQLPSDVSGTYETRLVVLTDGYFDFEHNTHGLKQGNRATDSRMLNRLRRDANWQQTLARSSEGLIPVQKPLPNLSVCVVEVRPKFDNLNEADLLVALWNKWLAEMQVRQRIVQLQGSLPKSLAVLNSFLK